MRTEGFSYRGSFSVQHEERPEHSHHVEAEVAQEGTRGHRERLDQRHAARNHRGHKDTGACGGERRSTRRKNCLVFFVFFKITPVASSSSKRESTLTKQGADSQSGRVRV